jgi:hypothetical protein
MSASPLGVTLLAALESRASVPVHHALSSETSPASVAAAVDAVGQLSIGETGTSSRADDGIEPALSAREIVSRPVVVPQQSRAATVEDICRSLAPPMAGVSQKGQELEPEIRTAQPVPIPNERVMSSGKSNNRHGSYRHADNGLVTLVPKARTKAKASTPSSSGPNAGSAGAWAAPTVGGHWNLPTVGHLLVPIDGQLTTARDQRSVLRATYGHIGVPPGGARSRARRRTGTTSPPPLRHSRRCDRDVPKRTSRRRRPVPG